MCKRYETIVINIPAHHTWIRHVHDGHKNIQVDGCISGILRALNNEGVSTLASCCGHGNSPGSIVLQDGRELIIAPNYQTARLIEACFPDINGELPLEPYRVRMFEHIEEPAK